MEFYKETRFKNSEIGDVPENWDVVRLGDISEFKRGFSYRSNQITKEKTKIRFITINDIEKEGGLKRNAEKIYIKDDVEISENFFLEQEDILIANTDMSKGFIIGAPLLIEIKENGKEKLVYSMDLTKLLIDKSRVYPKFLFYLLSSAPIRRIMKTFAQGTNVLHLNHNLATNLKIPLPPIEEQKAISEILSNTDEAIQKVDESIEKFEKLKKGLMNILLNGKVRIKVENGKIYFYKETKFKNSEIGEVPEDWEVVRLGEIVEIYDNKRVPLNEQEREKMKGPYPYCGANGILDYINNYIFDGEYILLAEDGGYWGKFENSAYIMNGKFWVNNHAHVLKALNGIAYNRFLMYILNFLDLTPYIVGSTRGKLNQKDMKNIKLPLPPIEEQKAIAEILSKIDKVIQLKKEKKEKLQNIKKYFMNNLLTGKVRIKL
ncbi:restriction endonuclease subunit S [Methanocaldococcus sp.]